MFFILRAGVGRSRSGGRWDGQVAFPGGHAEAGESDHAAAARECLEEVGVDLDRPGAYRFLGCVRERSVQRSSGTLVVACRVYEQLLQEPQALRLQPDEVAACGWAPLELLLEEACAEPLQWAGYDRWTSVRLPVEELCLADGVSEKLARRGFVLWGLTLSMVNDLLLATELRSSPIELPRRMAAAAAGPHARLLTSPSTCQDATLKAKL